MSNSILQSEKQCYSCQREYPLHKHHILKGSRNRDNSEKYGLWVWLCPEHHTGKMSPHFNHEIDMYLIETAQRAFEETHSREEFRAIFGRNYLE